ncbi:hypothetical protein ILP97_12410 [Amycolatopsis sp. H6(2020)]|nr:hypothetical protein [Amycolatopsis sp. H6(2020)]
MAIIGSVAGSCGHPAPQGDRTMPRPDGWREITLGGTVGFAVPPDAQPQNVQSVDSDFGILRGAAYEVVYDHGRYGEDLAVLAEKPGFTRKSREVGGRAAEEITFRGDGRPWQVVRLLSTQQDPPNTTTIRVSCSDDDTCRLADSVFDSIRRIR